MRLEGPCVVSDRRSPRPTCPTLLFVYVETDGAVRGRLGRDGILSLILIRRNFRIPSTSLIMKEDTSMHRPTGRPRNAESVIMFARPR